MFMISVMLQKLYLIYRSIPRNCSEPKKSMYQTFLHISVVQKSMHLGVSTNQNRCTGGYQQTKVDAPRGIGRPKSIHQTGSGALTFWTSSFCSFPLIMEIKTYLPVMSMVVVAITTMMITKNILVNHRGH